MALLDVEDLYLYYRTRRGSVRAVDGVSFQVEQGETLALVGESGCGKTSTTAAMMKLLPRNVSRYEGKVVFNGQDIMSLPDEEFRKEVRWTGISIVFQGAMNALAPTMKVGYQVAEPLLVHLNADKEEAKAKAEEAIRSVRLPEYVAERYPHELSGGMKQRVVIAMALVMKPKMVILDEPTSALDTMTQASIINLLKRLKQEERLSYLFITHDLALASELAERVAIMYAGRISEIGSAEDIYGNPKHPYTQKLLSSVPRMRGDQKPTFIPGSPPDLVHPPPGCRFHPRCEYVFAPCKTDEPQLKGDGRLVSCWLVNPKEATA